MTTQTQTWTTTLGDLFRLASGRRLREEDGGQTYTWHLIVAAALAALVFASLWGVAAGGGLASVALANIFKVPLVVLLSALSAIPAGVLTLKLSGANYKTTDLLLSFSSSVLSATLVLAVLAPLVAVYYFTSAWAGPIFGLGSTFVALGVGTILFVRNSLARRPEGTSRKLVLLAVSVSLFIQVATLLQLIAIASPILPEQTVFSGGIDQMIGH